VSRYLAKGDFVYRERKPLNLVNGDGARVTDIDGRVLIDAEACNGAASLGYDRTILEEAIGISGGLPAAPSFCETPLRTTCAEKLCTVIDSELNCSGKVAFELGGAQGVELALKIASLNRPYSMDVRG